MHAGAEVGDERGIGVQGALAAVAVENGQRRVRRQGKRHEDVAGAHVVVGLHRRQIGATAAPAQPQAHSLLHTQCIELAVQVGVPTVQTAPLAFAAEVIDIDVTVAAQPRINVSRRAAATVRKAEPVIDGRGLGIGGKATLPVGIEAMVERNLGRCGTDLKRLRPALVVQVQARVDRAGQGIAETVAVAVKQPEPRHRRLALALILKIG